MTQQNNHNETIYSRRSFLKMLGVGGAGIAIGASGVGSIFSFKSMFDTPQDESDTAYQFYGKVQPGITTPPQKNIHLAVLDLKNKDTTVIRKMFKSWTQSALNMMQGKAIGKATSNTLLPPVDTGEALDLDANKLTLTFGVSRNFLQQLGLKSKIPHSFKDLPHFPNDQLDKAITGGDIFIQACADDPQVAFHAIHNLIRPYLDVVQVKWSETGFISGKGKETPRNLMAFKDGTQNPRDTKGYKNYVFLDDGWAKYGTYCVLRKIQIHIETWDRTALEEQEATFGRHRASGAPLGKKNEFDDMDLSAKDAQGADVIPKDAHTRLAKEANTEILRRAYNYMRGTDNKTGNYDAGLLFISFQKHPQQFIDIQNSLGSKDKLNEYITHRGSGLFLILPGVKKGGYLGEALFN
ncbi:iron uptake transporter deferrochelatase/peroxidase subunit [Staphylococcus lutrae]|uniref:Deferrochelatase n=1 Tax=Staphylococcus lutrae TaxID=155085 RepID=A0AAC9RNZ9_9STAP|nr:iron uptake transporter deferrochelatase/peroxidase subunit [Staphylococcus lutrae]ARJ51158.1 deferrochelatase/peroxidase EfeB [Staphylococcus lutrae]PNZ37916.1 deferrochelatase/peroxidase EfeB [Staphylococcus lutrae]